MPSQTPLSVIYFGTPDFAAQILEVLLGDPNISVKAVVTQEDKASGRGKTLSPTPVKALATSHGLPVFQPKSIKKHLEGFTAAVNAYGPFDIGIVAAYGQILPQAILDLPRKGCINIHASLLPRWRGAAPMQRTIMAGDKTSGVCIMQMESGLDTGPVFCLQKIEIPDEANLGILHDTLAQAGAQLLIANIGKIVHGSISASPQPADGVTYASKISRNDEEIDWTRTAHEISNQVRALSPFPCAYTIFNEKRLKVCRSRINEHFSSSGQPSPGVISFLDKNCLEVACGKGALFIEEVQLEGKKRMPVKDFLAGCEIRKGCKLGHK